MPDSMPHAFSTAPSRDPRAARLRGALAANAIFSALSGLAFAIAPELVADLYTSAPLAPSVVRAIGIGLLGFALVVALEARRRRPRGLDALLIVAADATWVLATLVLVAIFASAISVAGTMLALGVGAIVALFAVIQATGVHRHFSTPVGHPRRARHCVSIEVDASPAAMWRVIADLGSIAEHHPSLVSSRLQGDIGVGAVRFCESREGEAWSEECTAFDADRRALRVRFRHEEAGFPFPVREMIGGWDVRPSATRPDASYVRVWWEMTPKSALFGPLLIALASSSLDRAIIATIEHMAGKRTPSAHAAALAC